MSATLYHFSSQTSKDIRSHPPCHSHFADTNACLRDAFENHFQIIKTPIPFNSPKHNETALSHTHSSMLLLAQRQGHEIIEFLAGFAPTWQPLVHLLFEEVRMVRND